MNRVILTIGPQFAGKSTFCEKVISAFPEVILVSRDAILIELFGTVWLDPYTGGHYVGWQKLWEIVGEHLQRSDVTMLLDAWNGGANERQDIITKLRGAGATRIDAWYFVTPEDTCVDWYLTKDPPKGKTEKSRQLSRVLRISSYRECYRAFHWQCIERESGFVSLTRVNPLAMIPTDVFKRE